LLLAFPPAPSTVLKISTCLFFRQVAGRCSGGPDQRLSLKYLILSVAVRPPMALLRRFNMSHQLHGAGRAITDYFNSPSFHAPKESELLEVIMMELMQSGKSPSNKAIIANVIARLEREADESVLQGYRNLLAKILEGHE